MSQVVVEAIDRYSPNHPLNAALATAITRYKIANIPEFLGQVFVESAGLTALEENLNYSAEALIRAFSPRRISKQDAETYGRTDTHGSDPQRIANLIYGGEWGLRHLGNTQPNDGWHFRGFGLIQLTGRSNVTSFARWLGNPEVVLHPNLLARDHGIACASACWYWTVHRPCNRLGGDVAGITREVTGSSTKMYARRLDMTQRFRKLLR